LLDRLGSAAAVDTAVDLFYRQVLVDPLLKPFCDRVGMKRPRAQQKAILAFAFRGSANYSGKDLRAA
jgi:hemoglobin